MSGGLLDTHPLLWLVEGDPRLGEGAKAFIETGTQPLFVSYASLWEIAIKQSIGKLRLSLSLTDFVRQRVLAVGMSLLPVRLKHIGRCSELPLHHRDPFDRLLVAQCLIGDLTILSRDPGLDAYGVVRVWD